MLLGYNTNGFAHHRFRQVLDGLKAIDYQGGLYVGLSRHSHDAVNTARAALAYLQARLGNNEEPGL